MALRHKIALAKMVTAESWNQFSRRVRRQSFLSAITARSAPSRIVMAPPSLRATDKITALDIYAGRFYLAGEMVELEGQDPFKMQMASREWQADLHSFQWIRHLAAAQTSLSANNAQALIQDWMNTHGKPRRTLTWEPMVTAYRLISWIFNAVPVVESADPAFYKNWLRSIGIHIRYLKSVVEDAPEGFPRLCCRIALAYAAICVADQTLYLRNAASLLDRELALQILEDGGHISRNPSLLPEILALLLPLRQSYARLGIAPSQGLVSAIDRMMAALKFYRLGDGNFARFNGVSTTPAELVSTILRHDDSKGTASNEAKASQFQRIEHGDTILIMDCGKPPKNRLSAGAHAGVLSFEFSNANMPIVVNCGAPTSRNPERRFVSRLSAAHSTAIVQEQSSSVFYTGDVLGLNGRILEGPRNTMCAREEAAHATTLKASHDGYKRSFGIIHQRLLGMDGEGSRILGEDTFTAPSGKPVSSAKKAGFTIRFHLHPSLSAGKTENGRSILIMGGKGIAWKFTCVDILPQLEESIFFAAHNGARRTRQIVLSGNAHKLQSVRWVFEKQLQENPS